MSGRGLVIVVLASLALAAGGALRAEERVELLAGEEPAVLDVQPVRVFREGAVVHVHVAGAAAPRREAVPKTRWLAGAVRGAPGSLAVLAVEADGRGRGFVAARGRRRPRLRGGRREPRRRSLRRRRRDLQSVDCLVPASLAVFDDGFEIGDTARWSATSPRRRRRRGPHWSA